jgi:hypothetical protein
MFSVLFLIRIHERVNGCQELGGYAGTLEQSNGEV